MELNTTFRPIYRTDFSLLVFGVWLEGLFFGCFVGGCYLILWAH